MDILVLQQINRTFENIRTTIKSKSSPDKVLNLKKDIHALESDLQILGRQNHDQFVRSLAMDGYLALLAAKTMPLSNAEKKDILQGAFVKLKAYALREECLFIFLRIQNLYCYYLIQLDQVAVAREILEGTEDLYDKIAKSPEDKYLDAEDLFSAEPLSAVRRISLEKIDRVITNNVQMQAFVYNILNIPEKYCLYNHTALRRQLVLKEGTPQDWAMRAARLGNYFTYLQQPGNARHHLCAAYHVLRTCHDNCKHMPEEFMTQKPDFDVYFLELSHHWVKYGLTLFKVSKKTILSRYFSEESLKADLWKTVDFIPPDSASGDDVLKNKAEMKANGDACKEKLFLFPSLDLREMEARVPHDKVTTVEEARKLFAFTHKWLMRTKHYYDMENHPAQYISCSLQLAELYEHLAFFERSIDSQYTIQKRRADVLETLNSLLKTCDGMMSVQIDVIRELSQVQLELMALTLQRLWHEESQTNMFRDDTDADSIIKSLDAEPNKRLSGVGSLSKSVVLRKMEATTTINGKLFRLGSQMTARSPSQLSFSSGLFKD